MRLPYTLLMLACGLLIACGIFYFMSKSASVSLSENLPEGMHHTIVLRNEGYVPKELTIKKGDVVTFSTDRGFQHWPASNVHPTHNEYAAFDPKRPLASDETWSFQFTKEGSWAFHDHLNATFTGRITVTP